MIIWSEFFFLSETGLLTIGPRFGGAIDDAARYFKDAYDRVSDSRVAICMILLTFSSDILNSSF